MPPAPDLPRRPVPRVFLERVSRPLLLRLLSPHARSLTARDDFPEAALAALAASAQTERTHVAALWSLLSAPPPELSSLHDDLLAVADVSTRAGHEVLLAHDAARVLDHELGDEDCAAVAFLEHRPLFDTARPQAGTSQTKSFASFESKAPRPLPDDPAHADAFARAMGEELLARGRTRYFRTHEWRSGTEHNLELRYGRLASARDLLGKTNDGAAHDVTAQVTDRTTEHAHAVFHEDTLRLDVAGPDWMKELVRRVFGESYFGSASHFEGDETLTLLPLAALETALATYDVPGLTRVELHEVWIDLGDGSGWIAAGARGDCTKGAAGRYALRALEEGAPVDATFHLWVSGKTRPVKLHIVTPRKLDFDRRDRRVVRIVRDWVVAAGYMRVPEHLRRSESVSPSVVVTEDAVEDAGRG